MTYYELSRQRAIRSTESLLSALEEYMQRKDDPRNRCAFIKSDGVLRIGDQRDLPSGLIPDLVRLRDGLLSQCGGDVESVLLGLHKSDYAMPFEADINYRSLYVELFNRSREYVEISTLAPSLGNDRLLEDGATHGPDFRDVTWYGINHIFTPNQAACLRVLWEAWMIGNPWVADGTLLQKAGIGDRQRLRDVFRNHHAWGTMIVQGPQQDLHGLKKPEKI